MNEIPQRALQTIFVLEEASKRLCVDKSTYQQVGYSYDDTNTSKETVNKATEGTSLSIESQRRSNRFLEVPQPVDDDDEYEPFYPSEKLQLPYGMDIVSVLSFVFIDWMFRSLSRSSPSPSNWTRWSKRRRISFPLPVFRWKSCWRRNRRAIVNSTFSNTIIISILTTVIWSSWSSRANIDRTSMDNRPTPRKRRRPTRMVRPSSVSIRIAVMKTKMKAMIPICIHCWEVDRTTTVIKRVKRAKKSFGLHRCRWISTTQPMDNWSRNTNIFDNVKSKERFSVRSHLRSCLEWRKKWKKRNSRRHLMKWKTKNHRTSEIPSARESLLLKLLFFRPRSESSPLTHVIPPPPDVKPIIDKLAEYVARNGSTFEESIRTKNDPRFGFLERDHIHYNYFQLKVQLSSVRLIFFDWTSNRLFSSKKFNARHWRKVNDVRSKKKKNNVCKDLVLN